MEAENPSPSEGTAGGSCGKTAALPKMSEFPQFGELKIAPLDPPEWEKLRKLFVDTSGIPQSVSPDDVRRLMATVEILTEVNVAAMIENTNLAAACAQLEAETAAARAKKRMAEEILAAICKDNGGRIEISRLACAAVPQQFVFQKNIHPGTGAVTLILREGQLIGAKAPRNGKHAERPRPTPPG